MADYEVTLSVVNGEKQTTTKSVILENYQRNTAIPKGIDEIMRWAEEEARANPDASIPAKAIEYWNTARASGSLQLYEIQSNLEAWGVAFGIKEVEEAIATTSRPHRNGTAPKAPTPPARFDLDGMLGQQLELLQARQKEVSAERKALQIEYDENQASIAQITQFLVLRQPPKKRGKKVAEAEQS